MDPSAVELLGIGFDYGRRPALIEVDLAIPVGSWAVCLGLNGAGKSTLLRIMAGQLRTRVGQCRVFGVPPKSALARGRFWFQPADAPPLPHTTIEEYVQFSLGLFDRPRLKRAKLPDLAARFGLAGQLRRPLSSLSRGQFRRAELLALRVVDPDLWILDEPHSGLDAEGQSLLVAECVQARSRGRTLVVASHTFLELASAPDQIIVLREGRLAWQGDSAALAAALKVWNWSISAGSPAFEASLRAWATSEFVGLTGPTAPTPSQILEILRGRGR